MGARVKVDTNDELAYIGQELAQIRNYLMIQSTRYGEELVAVIRIEPGTEQARIPRLLLQPLVENVFVHAFADKLTDRVLIIRTAHTPLEAGQGLMIEIIHNGSGMDEDQVQRILAAAGEPYGVTIESKPRVGTTVGFLLPMETERG